MDVRKELKADLEARAMRKADEYAYDCLTWKVFKAWRGHMMSLIAKARAVRGQKRYREKERLWKRWRDGLDAERLVWWEVGKHADAMGKRCSTKFYWARLVAGVHQARRERREDEMVKAKMMEVKGWLKG